MARKFLIDERRTAARAPCVSLNPANGRLGLNAQSYDLMKRRYGSDFEFIRIAVDEDEPTKFWLEPCEKSDHGARKILKAQNAKRLSAKLLITHLGLSGRKALRYEVKWDGEHRAAVVETAKVL